MRQGFSLIELVLVIAVAGLVAAIAIPGTARSLASIEAEHSVHTLLRAHGRARMTAILTSRVALLRLTPDSLVIQTVAGTDTVTTWRSAGPAARGVLLRGPTRPLLFSPVGMTYGFSNGTWEVEYRGAVRRLIASRYGRLRIERN